MKGLRRLGGVLALLCLWMPPLQAADALTFDTISGLLKPRPNQEIRFREARELSYLNAPLILEGWVKFTPPAQFERRVLDPISERYVIDGAFIRITDQQGRTRTLTLADYPPLAGLADGIRATLTGDLETLRQRFSVSVGGTTDDWWIDLTPTDPPLAEAIARLRFEGQGPWMQRMILTEADQSVTRTTFESPAP